MLAVATASTLFLAWVGSARVDPALRPFAGANISLLAQHLLTILGCYELAGCLLPVERLRCWRTFTLVIGAALSVTYLCGNAFQMPTREFDPLDAWGVAHDWLFLGHLIATFGVVLTVTIANYHSRGPDLRLSMALMFGLGTLGLTFNVAVGILFVAAPQYLAANYHTIATAVTIPALILLAAAGIPGLIAAGKAPR